MRNKGVHVLLEALRGVDARAVIVGFGEDRAELEALAGRDVLFTGPLEHRHLVHLLALADACVVPSIFPEAFGMVAAEAAAAGCPPIVARHSGLAEIAAGLEEAYPPALRHLAAFATGDADDLRAKLTELLALPPADREAIREAARRATVERWSWTSVAAPAPGAAQGLSFGAVAAHHASSARVAASAVARTGIPAAPSRSTNGPYSGPASTTQTHGLVVSRHRSARVEAIAPGRSRSSSWPGPGSSVSSVSVIGTTPDDPDVGLVGLEDHPRHVGGDRGVRDGRQVQGVVQVHHGHDPGGLEDRQQAGLGLGGEPDQLQRARVVRDRHALRARVARGAQAAAAGGPPVEQGERPDEVVEGGRGVRDRHARRTGQLAGHHRVAGDRRRVARRCAGPGAPSARRGRGSPAGPRR